MGYSNRISKMLTYEFLRTFYGICADFYRLFSSLQTFIEFTDFSPVYRLLQTFLEFTDFWRHLLDFLTFKMFLVLFKFIEFYGFLRLCSLIYVFFCTDFP